MAERLLSQIRKRLVKRRIGVFIEEGILKNGEIKEVGKLMVKLKEIGKPIYQIFIAERRIKPDAHTKLADLGFAVKMVPEGSLAMNFFLETYDTILSDNLDIIVVGTHRELMAPLLLEARTKTGTVFIFATVSKIPNALANAVDDVLTSRRIDDYYFDHGGIEVDISPKSVPAQSAEKTNTDLDTVSMAPISEEFDKEQNITDKKE